MSYARFVESDIYVYLDVSGYLVCVLCTLNEANTFRANNTQMMVAHIKQHEAKGDYVPSDIYQNLWKDDKENFYKK